MNTAAPDPLQRIADVARLLSVSRWTVRRWIAKGTLEAINLNPRPSGRPLYRVRRSTVDDLLARLSIGPAASARNRDHGRPEPPDSTTATKPKRSKPKRPTHTRRHYV